ncbi:hypothetical protein DOTSEDRAFT_53210 [Dothistroma septosporum NZE10]|uniref:Uncharacterized protein n=1 Tax=Dothistroma septosporum (strain NZE10 / CBS 128990) TaxID=675120 RepID=N1PKD0_DOTSN|nr:hypothetical protein DOTSEDRAFT_53210 [Dothistroma septosporum NZE10]
MNNAYFNNAAIDGEEKDWEATDAMLCEQHEAGDELEAELRAALADGADGEAEAQAEAAADIEVGIIDVHEDENLLILEDEEFPPKPEQRTNKKPILTGPMSLHQCAFLHPPAEAQGCKAVGQHPTPKAAGKLKKEEMEPLHKVGSGRIKKMMPLARLNPGRRDMRTSAIFNHGRVRPWVRKELLPSSSRPLKFWGMTNEQYAEHVKNEKKARRR